MNFLCRRCLQSRADKQQLTTEVQEDGSMYSIQSLCIIKFLLAQIGEAHVSNTQSTQSNNMAELTREEETQVMLTNCNGTGYR